MLESYRASITTTLAHFAASFTRPTLVIGGGRDILTPNDEFNIASTGLKHGVFHVVPDGGHLLPYESASDSADLIAAWERSCFNLTASATVESNNARRKQ